MSKQLLRNVIVLQESRPASIPGINPIVMDYEVENQEEGSSSYFSWSEYGCSPFSHSCVRKYNTSMQLAQLQLRKTQLFRDFRQNPSLSQREPCVIQHCHATIHSQKCWEINSSNSTRGIAMVHRVQLGNTELKVEQPLKYFHVSPCRKMHWLYFCLFICSI